MRDIKERFITKEVKISIPSEAMILNTITVKVGIIGKQIRDSHTAICFMRSSNYCAPPFFSVQFPIFKIA